MKKSNGWNYLNGVVDEEKYKGFTVVKNVKAGWCYAKANLSLEIGEKYVYSAYLKSSADNTIQFEGDKINAIIGKFNDNTWHRVKNTFVATANYDAPKITCNAVEKESFYICGIKIEKEETPTDWTPSIEDIENEIASAKDILNKTYPIGSIYMSVNSTNPSTLFGGTWERLAGRFLIGAGTNTEINSNEEYGDLGHGDPNFVGGETGGEYYHRLTNTEMPMHRHDTNDYVLVVNKNAVRISTNMGAKCVNDTENTNIVPNIKATKNEDSNRTGFSGDDGKHSNMPPYLAVYMWKRTA